jgi:hypothetical protein
VAARDVLDRAGFKGDQPANTPWNGDFRTLTDEQLDNMLKSYAEVNGLSVDYIEKMRLQILGLDPSVRAEANAAPTLQLPATKRLHTPRKNLRTPHRRPRRRSMTTTTSSWISPDWTFCK